MIVWRVPVISETENQWKCSASTRKLVLSVLTLWSLSSSHLQQQYPMILLEDVRLATQQVHISKFHHLPLLAFLVAQVSHSSNFCDWPLYLICLQYQCWFRLSGFQFCHPIVRSLQYPQPHSFYHKMFSLSGKCLSTADPGDHWIK